MVMMTMAARIPVRFERVAAAFDADVARVRLCESSGSEHSPESSSADLSDLVKSFMEKSERGEEARECDGEDEECEASLEHEKCEWSDDSDEIKKEKLQMLLEGSEDDRNEKEKIRREVEVAYGLIGDKSSPEFKRRLMTRLREKGFDAGLCKSKWEKSGRFPGGDYEYIDINTKSGKRYIIEVCLSGEFQIARPTHHYTSLLQVFPSIFIGKVEELKKIMRLMCTAMKASMKSMDLFVPPWRRHGYMKAKWFSSYRRTTNEMSIKKVLLNGGFSINGFEAKPVKAYICRDDYGRNKGSGLRIGLLATALNS